MTSDFFKQVKNSAKEEAIKAARQVRQEPLEILKDINSNVSGQTDIHQKEISMMQQVMTGDGKVADVSSQDEQKINILAKRRLQEIEQELRRMRILSEQRSGDWVEKQKTLMTEGDVDGKQKVFLEPTPKRKTGMIGPGQKKQGTKEMGKQYSG